MELALFDFDGTISTKDSTIDFIIKYSNKLKLLLSIILVVPLIILLLLRFIKFITFKEIMLIYFFKNWNKNRFDNTVNKYLKNQMPGIIRKNALDRIEWHKNKSHKIVIITGAINLLLEPWCDERGIDLIAVELEVKNNKITGKLTTPNCYGVEKVRRIKEKYHIDEFSKIYAYGNSNADREMLKIADEKYYKYFE